MSDEILSRTELKEIERDPERALLEDGASDWKKERVRTLAITALHFMDENEKLKGHTCVGCKCAEGNECGKGKV